MYTIRKFGIMLIVIIFCMDYTCYANNECLVSDILPGVCHIENYTVIGNNIGLKCKDYVIFGNFYKSSGTWCYSFDYSDSARNVLYILDLTETKSVSIKMYNIVYTDSKFRSVLQPNAGAVKSDNNLVFVNKQNRVPSEYKFKSVNTSNKGYKTKYSNLPICASVEPYLRKMLKGMKSEIGCSVRLVSGYRTLSEQKYILSSTISRSGYSNAILSVMKPGYSEHHTGLAIDMDVNELRSFSRTKQSAWLAKNAYKFGFVLRYPKNATGVTKIVYESWHYRFVGLNCAKFMHKNGFVFEQFKERIEDGCLVYNDYMFALPKNCV